MLIKAVAALGNKIGGAKLLNADSSLSPVAALVLYDRGVQYCCSHALATVPGSRPTSGGSWK